MTSKGLQVGDQIVELAVLDLLLRKGRHGAESVSHLKLLHETPREKRITSSWVTYPQKKPSAITINLFIPIQAGCWYKELLETRGSVPFCEQFSKLRKFSFIVATFSLH
jgi:hypothetical protein